MNGWLIYSACMLAAMAIIGEPDEDGDYEERIEREENGDCFCDKEDY